MQEGKLFEISPFGTGFIEFADGRVVGFHHSMLTPAVPRRNWSRLEGQTVAVELVEGAARQVQVIASDATHTANARTA